MAKRTLILVLILLLGLSVRAQQIVFTPQWAAQSQFAGYYVAQELGFYKDAGVDVVIEHSSTSDMALNRMLSGKSNAVTMFLYDAICRIDQGIGIVNILQTSQRPGQVVVVRNDSIANLEDLQGKRVGIWHSHFNQISQFMNMDYNLNIEWIMFIQNINLYISGAVDATMAMIYNEVYWILSSGFKDKKIIPFEDIGYDFPDEGLYISREYYNKYPDKARAFAEASRKGWEWAHKHPEQAVDIVMKVMEREKVPASRRHQEWMLREVLKLQCRKGENVPNFKLDTEKVKELNKLLLYHGSIDKEHNVEQIQGTKVWRK